ncbi:MAG TPA: hypothetical protein VHA80_04200 [Solirubrobacterales bacterium]|nr:hypothetical protein [Solirubrobacterales bacterium]
MTTRQQKKLAAAAGAIVGVAFAVALLIASRPGAAGSPLPAALRVSMAPGGALEVTPAPPRPLLDGRSLRPGGRPATADFRLRNQTGSTLATTLVAKADSTALDGLLRVRILAGGAPLADTTLQGIELHPPTLRLRSGEARRLRLDAWIPGGILAGWQGRLVQVTLRPRVRPIGGGT